MARFETDPLRINFTVEQKGKEYQLRLNQRTRTIFGNLMRLLPSNYTSTVEGPAYTNELKAVATELARIELALEDVNQDIEYRRMRTEFVYLSLGQMLFPTGNAPIGTKDDVAFREFLVSLLGIYFRGSIPAAMGAATELLLGSGYEVLENFLLERAGASGYDISDQFGFQVVVETNNVLVPELFDLQSSLRTILDIIRPAHTLFTLKYKFTDEYVPNDPVGVLTDQLRWSLRAYWYDDVRRYWGGVRSRDRLGTRTNQMVVAEDHSDDF